MAKYPLAAAVTKTSTEFLPLNWCQLPSLRTPAQLGQYLNIYKFKELVEVTAEDIATHTGEGLKDAHHLAGCKIQPSFANDPNFLFSSVSDAELSVEQ